MLYAPEDELFRFKLCWSVSGLFGRVPDCAELVSRPGRAGPFQCVPGCARQVWRRAGLCPGLNRKMVTQDERTLSKKNSFEILIPLLRSRTPVASACGGGGDITRYLVTPVPISIIRAVFVDRTEKSCTDSGFASSYARIRARTKHMLNNMLPAKVSRLAASV